MMRIALMIFTFALVLVALPAMAQQAQVVTVQQTDIKRIAGEVVQVRGNLLTLRHQDGSGREAYRIPRGASIKVQGTETRLLDLQPGQMIRIYYRETSRGRVIVLSPPIASQEPRVVVDDTPAEVRNEGSDDPPEESLPEMLPETASIVPLLGLLGGAFLSLGLIVAGVRRRLG
jgi:hypothetical protein